MTALSHDKASQPSPDPDGALRGQDLGIPGLEMAVEIGRGGFGVVYRVRQSDLGRDVAVKVLHGARPDEQGRRRFRREALAVGRVSGHPNIVTVHAAGFTRAGDPFIVMEYLPGGSLGDLVSAGGPLTWQRVSTALVNVAGALASAHAAGVLHRDVKPGNILLSPYGEQLVDFGVARIAGDEETQTSGGVTTIAHCAPEVLLGENPTAQSDIYALASTGFALLTGHAPFVRRPHDAVGTVVTRVANEPAPPLPVHVPRELASVIERALGKDAAHRPVTAREFGQAVQDAQRGAGLEPTTMVADAPPARRDVPFHAAAVQAKGGGARAWSVAAVSAALVVLFGAGVAVGRITAPPSPQAVPAASPNLLYQPRGVAIDATGGVLVVDHDQLFRVSSRGKVEVVAGAARHGVVGDGGPATQAKLDNPGAVAVDHAGNIYIADSSNNRVRVVRADGTIHTFAGNGQPGASGDGGPAIAAGLHDPEGLAVDAAGNVFIVDTANALVREVSAGTGVITTVIGSTDPNAPGISDTPALNYGLSRPTGIAMDSQGRLLVADVSAVLRLDADGRVRAIAGIPDVIGYRGDNGTGGTALLSGVSGIAVDAEGDILIADTGNDRVRKLSPTGVITTIGGDGQQGEAPVGRAVSAATSAEFDSPQGIAVDKRGAVYVVDSGNHRLCKITPDGRIGTILR